MKRKVAWEEEKVKQEQKKQKRKRRVRQILQVVNSGHKDDQLSDETGTMDS